MKLASQISIGCRSLQLSLEVYEKLGFKKVNEDFKPIPWVQMSDGSILLLLTEDGQEYIGLTYFSDNLEPIITELTAKGINWSTQKQSNHQTIMASFLTPDNFPITIVKHNPDEIYQPQGYNLATLPKEDYNNPQKYPNKKCGIFGEFTQFIENLERSKDFWERIGFKTLSVNHSPYPWAILSDGINIVGLHQNSDLSHPTAITYFAPDMQERIKILKKQGLNIKGSSLITPENQMFLLFSL